MSMMNVMNAMNVMILMSLFGVRRFLNSRSVMLFALIASFHFAPGRGFSSAKQSQPLPKVLLENADRARGGAEKGLSWKIELTTVDDGEMQSINYTVKTKNDNAYVEATEPAKNRGEVMLFNDRTIWFFKPGLKKPVSISARQKLSGQASNGDIASTNYARDYEGKIISQETVLGKECYKLLLTSQGKNTTYDQIHYWISKKERLAMQAEYLSLDGQVLKSAFFTYGNTLRVGEKKLPFIKTLRILDAKNKREVTTLTYSSPELVNNPDSLFNVNNLAR